MTVDGQTTTWTVTTRWEYADVAGRHVLLRQTDQAGTVTENSYDAKANLTQTVDRRGRRDVAEDDV